MLLAARREAARHHQLIHTKINYQHRYRRRPQLQSDLSVSCSTHPDFGVVHLSSALKVFHLRGR